MKFILSLENPNLEIESKNLKSGLRKLAELATELGVGNAVNFGNNTLTIGLIGSNNTYLFSEKTTNKAQEIFDRFLEIENKNFYDAMIHGGHYQDEESEWHGYSEKAIYL